MDTEDRSADEAVASWSWIAFEADAIMDEYPEKTVAELAASFERSLASYDGDATDAQALLAELRRRAGASA